MAHLSQDPGAFLWVAADSCWWPNSPPHHPAGAGSALQFALGEAGSCCAIQLGLGGDFDLLPLFSPVLSSVQNTVIMVPLQCCLGKPKLIGSHSFSSPARLGVGVGATHERSTWKIWGGAALTGRNKGTEVGNTGSRAHRPLLPLPAGEFGIVITSPWPRFPFHSVSLLGLQHKVPQTR